MLKYLETDGINVKRLGILIDENTISQYAMKKGISTTGKEMTQQQKILARYGAIMEQTKKAQGDLARTMESPTNQLRRMSAQVDAAKIALGTALQPALLAVLPVLTSLAVGAADVINAFTGMGKTTGLQDVLITLDEARAMAAEVVGTGFADIAKNIETASKNTSEAIATFETAEFATKKVFLAIDFDPPTVSNYQLVTEKMAALKADILALEGTVEKYITTYLKPLLMEGSITQATYDKRVASLQRQLDTLKTSADKLESKVTAKISAAMKDQNVTEEEKAAILKAIETEVNTATKDLTATAKAMKAQITADLKAKKITPEEAAAGVALVDAELATALTNLNATADNLKATVGIGDWSLITLTQTQTDDLAGKITAGIEASNVVAKATIDEVQAEFTGTGKIGLAVGTLYKDIGEKITAQNEIIAGMIDGWADGLGQPPTAEEVAAVQKEVAKRDTLLAMLNPKLGVSGAMTMNIGDLTLDSTSIKNYLAAINEAFASETTSAATNFEAQKVRLANAFGMPEWDSVLATYGLFGLDYAGAVEELRKQMADALAEEKNAAVINAAEKLLPSVAAAIASGDQKAIQDASAAVATFVAGIDVTTLNDKGKEAALALLNGLDLTYLNSAVADGIQDMKAEILLSMEGVSATFGEKGKESMLSLLTALEQGRLTQADFDSIIGASSSKTALAALAAQMYADGNTATGDLVMGLLGQITTVEEAAALLAEASKPKEPEKPETPIPDPPTQPELDTVKQGAANVTEAATPATPPKPEIPIPDAPSADTLQTVTTGAQAVATAATVPAVDNTGIGENAAGSVATGLYNKLPEVTAAADKIASEIARIMKLKLLIGSPSKVAIGLGEYVGEGLAIGMTDTTRMVSNAASALAMGATNALTGITATTPSLPTPNLSGSESAISRAVEQVMGRLNIELVVDGERLGRASIKAINGVQQRSGRTILSVT